jgi:hypothetical protein
MSDAGPIDDHDLEEIERRAAAATPGPWQEFIDARDDISGDDFIMTGGMANHGPDIYVSHENVPAPAADLEFIAHARQDVPRLVAEVRRLRALLGGRPGTK